MNENENEFVAPQDTEETVNEEVVIDLDEESEDSDDKDKIIATLRAQKDHWKNKATKKEEATPVKEDKPATPNALSTDDLFVLIKNNVEQEDISEVVEYATLKKIPISEALKSNVVKSILKEKAESRSVSQATHTGAAKRGSTKISDDELLANAKKGVLPESDADLTRLTELRYRK